jgi:hypothetical protein
MLLPRRASIGAVGPLRIDEKVLWVLPAKGGPVAARTDNQTDQTQRGVTDRLMRALQYETSMQNSQNIHLEI